MDLILKYVADATVGVLDLISLVVLYPGKMRGLWRRSMHASCSNGSAARQEDSSM